MPREGPAPTFAFRKKQDLVVEVGGGGSFMFWGLFFSPTVFSEFFSTFFSTPTKA